MSDTTHLTPVWIVSVDGKRLDTEHEGALTRIVINDRINGISTATLHFDTSAVKLRDKGSFSLESEIAIQLGYKDACAPVFTGEIIAFHSLCTNGHAESLAVECANILHKLTHATHCAGFTQKTADEIVKGIIDTYSLQADIDTFGATAEFCAQQNETDFMYISRIAAAYGKTIYASDATIFIKDEITTHSDQLIFEWGKTLISFEATENLTNLISKATFIGWDSLKNESFQGTAAIGDVPVKIGGSSDWTSLSKGGSGLWESCLIDYSLVDAADAEKRALGLVQHTSFNFCSASGSIEGNCKLFAGMRVQIKYTGDAYSGEYRTNSVTHTFDYTGGYRTSFTLQRNMSPC